MKDYITVKTSHGDLTIAKDYADLNNIKDNHQVKSDDEFWNILGGHAEHQISQLTLLIDADKKPN